jgi:hypothetical protein
MVKKCIESIDNSAKTLQKGYTITLTCRLFKRFQKRGGRDISQGFCNFIFLDTCFITIVTYSTYYIVYAFPTMSFHYYIFLLESISVELFCLRETYLLFFFLLPKKEEEREKKNG